MTISLPRQESQDWSSVGRELDCRAGGRGFDSRGRKNTQFLKQLRNKCTALALKRLAFRVAGMTM